ncbi:MAG: lactoylglutathione lyase, partial [Pseudomonadota bacterium]
MAKAIHTMVRVLDEDKSVNFYNTAFGLDVEDRF